MCQVTVGAEGRDRACAQARDLELLLRRHRTAAGRGGTPPAKDARS